MVTRRLLLLAGTLGVCVSGAAAQSYPQRPVRIIVPLVAGSPADIITRLVSDKMAASVKQPFVIENRPGAGGNIGLDAVARATPDGYTFGVSLNTMLTVNPSVYKKLPFDLDRDISPILTATASAQMLVVHPSIPVKTVAELVAYARAAGTRREPVSYASGGTGTPGHLTMENFRVRAGFEATHVPYRGNTPMVVDLVAGQIKVGFVSSAGMMDHVKAGRLRALAVSRATRSPLAPDVPTVAESGYPGFAVENYLVLVAPAGVPASAASLLTREIGTALKLPDVVERLRGMDTTAVVSTGPAVETRLKTERAEWAKVVAAANMQID